MGKQWKQWLTLFFGAPKSLQMVTEAIKLKDASSLEESYDQPRQHIKKQKHYFVNKGLFSQGYGFSSSHVWMWELDYKESWVPKNWCFWTMVLEKTLESPLDCKVIQPIHPKDRSWMFTAKSLQSCPTLCDPTDRSPLSLGFSRQEHWSRLPSPSALNLSQHQSLF